MLESQRVRINMNNQFSGHIVADTNGGDDIESEGDETVADNELGIIVQKRRS